MSRLTVTMSRPTVLLICLGLTLTLPCLAADTTPTTYGEGVDVATVTPIADLVADPEAYEGQTVRVEGKINDVCPKKGCWMTLTEGEHTVRVKVEDDVIVFPQTAKGHHAAAQGVVAVRDLDRDAYVGWMAHLAEERGETFDDSTVGEGPYRIVQIQGTGAEISE
ncbi:MAG: DUF4920 domain-containing protein [Acidobacteriota bacterium]